MKLRVILRFECLPYRSHPAAASPTISTWSAPNHPCSAYGVTSIDPNPAPSSNCCTRSGSAN